MSGVFIRYTFGTEYARRSQKQRDELFAWLKVNASEGALLQLVGKKRVQVWATTGAQLDALREKLRREGARS
jgi:hypothetical protein